MNVYVIFSAFSFHFKLNSAKGNKDLRKAEKITDLQEKNYRVENLQGLNELNKSWDFLSTFKKGVVTI